MYVEFLGIPRERAGTAAVEIEADTLGEVLDVLAVRFPSMAGLVGGRAMHPSVAANLNGDRFVRGSADAARRRGSPAAPVGRRGRVTVSEAHLSSRGIAGSADHGET